ncbi:MAG: diaminopimelate decarboxylase [Gammaproteobacteria bacterium]
MSPFAYRGDRLFAEDVAVEDIAQAHGTPCYVYSRAAIERQWRAFDHALRAHPHLLCYAVKANSNVAVLNVLARLGSGFDIVSVGELERVLRAGGDPARIVFSGVGKRADEMQRALEAGILCFNVESEAELDLLAAVAADMHAVAPVSLRVNPDVDARTHPYISTGLKENKFGIGIDQALEVYRRAAGLARVRLVGIDCHIGSQLTELAPFVDALRRVLRLGEQLEREGISIDHLDLGGGLGIRYHEETAPTPGAYVETLLANMAERPYRLLLEPGRAIVGDAGILVTRVQYTKDNGHKRFAVVDAAMNDFLRPAMYDAWHSIVPVARVAVTQPCIYDVVGPVCETADFIGKERALAVQGGELLAVHAAGAYGFSMAGNYNTRPRAAEVMVDGGRTHLIRERETLQQMLAGEHLLP